MKARTSTLHQRLVTGVCVFLAIASVALALIVVTTRATPSTVTNHTIWSDSVVPQTPVVEESRPVVLGLRFRALQDGTLTAIRFYRSSMTGGSFTGRLWSADGQILAEGSVASTRQGWQLAPLKTPVRMVKNQTYVASYLAPQGEYAADRSYFATDRTGLSSVLRPLNGTFTYGDGFPDDTWHDTNYYVDVVAATGAPDSEVDPGKRSSEALVVAPPSARDLTLRPVDGGTTYYRKFTNALPSDESFFPTAVWYESVVSPKDLTLDRAAGINLYLELTTDSNLALIRKAGSKAITSWPSDDPSHAGLLVGDEVDMWAGAGGSRWTGKFPGQGEICSPKGTKCGYDLLARLVKPIPQSTMTYANYGKGVTFWSSDKEAARFVNDFTDVVSVDNYWFTDPNICGPSEGGTLLPDSSGQLSREDCRRGSNYGASVERVRSLVSPVGSKPVWNFVEVGHPFGQDWAPTITGPQIRSAVWSSIVHGARGIVYFNHNFGGPCKSQHVLRDACGTRVRPDVAALNKQIQELAPVLNAPFVDGLVRPPAGIQATAKLRDGHFYVMATSSGDTSAEDSTLTVGCGATSAEVIDENRTVTIRDGRLVDRFADADAVHIYRLVGGDTCGLK